LRTEAAGIYSLIRNVGASIGISFCETELARGMQISHQSFAAQMTPFNRALTAPGVQAYWNIHSPAGLAALNAEISRQAVMQAYINDFMLIMMIALASVPLLLLLREVKAQPGAAPAVE